MRTSFGHKERNRVEFPEAMINNRLVRMGAAPTLNSVSGMTSEKLSRSSFVERVHLEAVSVAITAALDYASLKLFDLPNSNLTIVGAVIDIGTVAGTGGVSDPNTIDFALGTVAITSTNFSNSGEQDIVPEGDVSSLKMKGSTTGTEDHLFIAEGASNAVYLNLQDTIGSDGTIVLTGKIDVIYDDIGRAVS